MRLTNLIEHMGRNNDTDVRKELVVQKFLRCMPKR